MNLRDPGSADFMSQIKRIPELDTDYAIDTMGGSEALYEKMLRHVVHLIPSNIEKLEKYLDADNGLSDFGVMAHGIKSSLNQVGYLWLAKRAESLEKAAKAGGKPYCSEHYAAFRDDLLRFYEMVNEADRQTTKETDAADACGDIKDFSDVLRRAKESAGDFDSMSAAEILSPLTKHRFGGNIDDLVSKTAEALYVFNPRQASEYITQLLDECK